MKDIVILGSGGFAKEVAFLIEDINKIKKEWNLLGYIAPNVSTKNGKYSVIGDDDWLIKQATPIYVAFGFGNPNLIEKLYKKLQSNKNLFFPNLIHPNVIGDWEKIEMGVGNIICASNTLTTDIKIGNFNVINLDCTIGHDTIIRNYNVINPSVNISGGVILNNNILIGTNATILQYHKIESNVIIGASPLVTKDIVESGVYVGVPVKKIR